MYPFLKVFTFHVLLTALSITSVIQMFNLAHPQLSFGNCTHLFHFNVPQQVSFTISSTLIHLNAIIRLYPFNQNLPALDIFFLCSFFPHHPAFCNS